MQPGLEVPSGPQDSGLGHSQESISRRRITSEALDTLTVIDQNCQQIMDVIEDAVDEVGLAAVIAQFAGSSNPLITQALSFLVASSDASDDEHLLVFPLIEALSISDGTTFTNLLTALTRLDQQGIDWQDDTRLELVDRLLERCAVYTGSLQEYAAQYRERHHPDRV
jgi:hypothetical protein